MTKTPVSARARLPYIWSPWSKKKRSNANGHVKIEKPATFYGEKLVDVLQSQRPVQLIQIGARKLNVNCGEGACSSKSGAVANKTFGSYS